MVFPVIEISEIAGRTHRISRSACRLRHGLQHDDSIGGDRIQAHRLRFNAHTTETTACSSGASATAKPGKPPLPVAERLKNRDVESPRRESSKALNILKLHADYHRCGVLFERGARHRRRSGMSSPRLENPERCGDRQVTASSRTRRTALGTPDDGPGAPDIRWAASPSRFWRAELPEKPGLPKQVAMPFVIVEQGDDVAACAGSASAT